jgi:signal transduction histidine kinase
MEIERHAGDDRLAIVAHELRTPLAAIAAHVSVLRGQAADARTLAHLDAVERTVRRMERLARDLLDAASVAQGRLSVTTGPESAAGLLGDATRLLSPLAAARSVRLEAQLPEKLPLLLCDHDRMVQVLCNLVGNAVEHCVPGGRVRVRAERRDGDLLVAVSDDGDGIPADELPHVFERWFRGRKRRGAGAGLGLAIAREIVEAHGGRMWAESPPGAGAAFYFTLPLPAVTAGPVAASEGPAG